MGDVGKKESLSRWGRAQAGASPSTALEKTNVKSTALGMLIIAQAAKLPEEMGTVKAEYNLWGKPSMSLVRACVFTDS